MLYMTLLEDDNFTDARGRFSGTDDDAGKLCTPTIIILPNCELDLFVISRNAPTTC